MRINIRRYSLSLFVLFLSFSSIAQTADEIIGKNIEALGGKDKLNAIQTVYAEGVSVMQNGNEIDSKIWRVKDKLYRQEINFGMGSIVIIATPKQGWRSNPRNGGNFEALPDEQLKPLQMQMDVAGPFVDYASKGSKIEMLGSDTVNGSPCYKIRLTTSSGIPVVYHIDTRTYYVLRETRKGNGMFGGGRRNGNNAPANGADAEFNIDFSDYQKTPDGYIVPFSLAIGGGPKTSFEKIEINKPVDEAKLSKPQ